MLFKILWQYARPYRAWLAIVVLCQAASTAAMLYLPTLNGHIIDDGIVKHDNHFILTEGGWMLAIAFGQALCSVVSLCIGTASAVPASRR
jgi:ATP-binding cassette, subfamily B, multidrug efflux pump